ncbi:MAG: glycosyltransferase family 87 protein [Mariniblastus sp.]|nr:glycosyltransferase family 87 protein [Mariniblastus sp.]
MSKANRKIHLEGSPLSAGWICGLFCLPLLLAASILFVSPNFQSVDGGVRASPMGGDFLQEWVGAYVARSADRDKLYDLNHIKAVQHDQRVVGFSWPEKDYFPMVYPPFYYQLLRPMTVMDYCFAMKVWLFLSGLSVSFSFWLLFRFYRPSRKWLGVGGVAAMLFVPLIICLIMGQKSTFLLLILTGTFVLFYNERPFWSGLVFGLIAFKPHLGVVIGIAMLLKGRWRFAAGALTTVVAMVGVSFFVSPQLWYDYLKIVGGMGDYVETGGYLLADSHGMWGAVQLTFSQFNMPDWFIKLIALMASLVVTILLWRVIRGPSNPIGEESFAAMVLATVMLSPHFYTYDLTILLLPMLLMATSMSRRKPVPKEGLLLGGVCVGIFVFAGSFKTFATSTSLQFSLPLMIAALVLLGQCSLPNRLPHIEN